MNLTHNGMENNKEHLYRIENPSCVEEVMMDFEEDWKKAEPVDQDLIDKMMVKHAEKEEEKESKRIEKEARSRSKSRGASRSLSAELDNAYTTPRAERD